MYLMKSKLDCECDNQPLMGDSFKEKIWYNQLQQKQILISGEIGEDLVEKATIHIFNFNSMDDENERQIKDYIREPIMVMINSGGGVLDESLSFISAIRNSKTKVITYALGKAQSAGFLILIAGHERYCQPYTSLMIHTGAAGIADSFGKIFEYADYWKTRQNMVDEFILKQTKIKKKDLLKNFEHKTDWYINPTEAINLGIVDGII